jgi:hypothetical protein
VDSLFEFYWDCAPSEVGRKTTREVTENHLEDESVSAERSQVVVQKMLTVIRGGAAPATIAKMVHMIMSATSRPSAKRYSAKYPYFSLETADWASKMIFSLSVVWMTFSARSEIPSEILSADDISHGIA